MWLFNDFPFERFEAEYGFAPTQQFLDHLRLSSVRFNNGGSGSFVSADGLTITNHHVGADCIQKLSSAEHDRMRDGFVAASRADEVPCPDLELNVLVEIESVTDRIRAAVGDETDVARAGELRRGAKSDLERQCQEASGLRCDVVTLYQGGQYDLYKYRRYTDVRLAFAPEAQLPQFGGDPDNFEYPRYSLDFALFRVWEDGKPAATPDHLSFDPTGAQEGEVAFLSGHPGSTARLDTVAQLEWLRDTAYPYFLTRLDLRRTAMVGFSARGAEQARIAYDDIQGIDNALKAISGYQSGLLDPELMARKVAQETELRKRVAQDPEMAAAIGDPWSDVEAALEVERDIYPRVVAMTGLTVPHLGQLARTIVRLVAEREKPDAERLREYSESAMPSLLQELYSEAPIYPEYEEMLMAHSLRALKHQLGPVHPLIVATFGDREEDELAHQLIAGTKLADPAVRKALVEGGTAAVAASDDPLIRFVRATDPYARELRAIEDDQVDSVEDRAGEKIAEAFFAVHGKDTYPDATFSLRLTYGRVTGYEEGGRQVPWHTVFQGYFDRSAKHDGKPPWDLPAGLVAAKERLDLDTPVDFLTTHDIIGGNSGSPVVDREGNFIGIVFDGNLYMLPNNFFYSPARSRAISVDARAILETLTAVYPAAKHLADELKAGDR
jgi:hypothetical protein